MVGIAAALGGELDIRAALRARFRGEAGRFNRYLFNSADAYRNGHEEYGSAALKTVRRIIDSINGYVDRAAGQIVVSRVASSWRLRPLRQPGERERVGATAERQFGDCLCVERVHYQLAGGLEQMRHVFGDRHRLCWL